MSRCLVFRVPTRHPGDVEGVLGLIEAGALAADEIVAIFGKTEGNGCVNDFTRQLAVVSLQAALAPALGCTPAEAGRRIAMVMSGGTEGGLSPHLLVLARRPDGAAPPLGAGARLAVGTASTAPFAPEEVGRLAQVEATAGAVRAAMAEAGIERTEDVHFVQIKCPLLTSERIAEAAARGRDVATHDTYESMGLSRGASALGAAVALGEVAAASLDDAAIGRRLDLWSARASASAGIELMHNEVVVLGNSAAWGGDLTIAHGVMRDGVDLPAILAVLGRLGFPGAGQLTPEEAEQVAAVLVKAEPARNGRIRGLRHIMWDDSDINATRHARALVGGVVGAAIGRTDLFVSGGAEHQGPDGGGPVAVIARVAPGRGAGEPHA